LIEMGNTIKCGKTQHNGATRRRRKSQDFVPAVACLYCHKSFSERLIMAHERKCYRNPRFIYLECEGCCKMFNLLNYEFHIEMCEAKYNNGRSSNSTNSANEEEEDNTKAYCEFCTKAVDITVYWDHVKRCTKNPKNVRVPCSYCRERFPSDLIKKHKVFCMRHPDNMVVFCYACKKEVKLRHYRMHLRECQEIAKQHPCQPEIECPICLCEIKKSDTAKTLTCKHIYHDDCIADWSKQRNDCPICRAKIQENNQTIEESLDE